MAVIHRTTLVPTKGELLTSWLPSRPWYRGGSAAPQLSTAGGFRLDDPEGEVGMEFIVTADATTDTTYFAPLTYRGAPLEGVDHALVGTLEHGVLGKRWVYDGCHDPVLTAQLVALIEGRARAQAQSISDTPDEDVTRSFTGPAPALFTEVTDGTESTDLTTPQGLVLRLHRVLRPGPEQPLPEGATGHVAGSWTQPDGSRARAVYAVLYGAGK
ncbi:hypothetical protein GCM10010218_44430 [Streptomyces mashuensis]|uniref:Maltokinase N-terminal cap domain-containing protein n=1 Tax=Streptomyces mashuensis TaxID=33904 RepID=A0A919B6R9_9ACTN|nr:1,4-alpha-glucan branching protein [Streptomyces mashuensis]GHF58105.1 hypothetical protein GCM10010218_44430 [Streptomyces mashuensis]